MTTVFIEQPLALPGLLKTLYILQCPLNTQHDTLCVKERLSWLVTELAAWLLGGIADWYTTNKGIADWYTTKKVRIASGNTFG